MSKTDAADTSEISLKSSSLWQALERGKLDFAALCKLCWGDASKAAGSLSFSKVLAVKRPGESGESIVDVLLRYEARQDSVGCLNQVVQRCCL